MSGIEEILIERTSEINKLRVDLLNSNKIIEQLEKENAELQEKLTNAENLVVKMVELRPYMIDKLMKEKSELEQQLQGLTPEMISNIKKVWDMDDKCELCGYFKKCLDSAEFGCNFKLKPLDKIYNDSEGENKQEMR